MAQIDVSDLLLDPDFTDVMQIIRRTATVNAMGENVVSEPTTVNTWGSVQSPSGKSLQRLPEALRSENLKSFFTKAPIVADASGVYTDIIVFQGARYQVKAVLDWTNWGAGWTEGMCVAEKPSA